MTTTEPTTEPKADETKVHTYIELSRLVETWGRYCPVTASDAVREALTAPAQTADMFRTVDRGSLLRIARATERAAEAAERTAKATARTARAVEKTSKIIEEVYLASHGFTRPKKRKPRRTT